MKNKVSPTFFSSQMSSVHMITIGIDAKFLPNVFGKLVNNLFYTRNRFSDFNFFLDSRSHFFLYRKFSDIPRFWSLAPRAWLVGRKNWGAKKIFFVKILFFEKIFQNFIPVQNHPQSPKIQPVASRSVQKWFERNIKDFPRISSPDDNFPQDQFLLLRDRL